jgi:S-formylglutathione hydrolase FrmB
VYVIQGYGGQADMWTDRAPFDPTVIERIDAMFSTGDCPDAVVAFVDAWTAFGGSQFLNSSGMGQYMDYLSDEVPAFVDERYPTLAAREHRGLAGKSSGGYGAMVVPMLRPDVWGALASHAGDALFECCYQRDFPTVARQLRDHFDGSYDKLLKAALEAPQFDWEKFGASFSLYAYALAYTPDPDNAGKALMPFEIATGKLIEEIWAKWLELDPVRMVSRHADALRSMRCIYLDAGKSDEWFLDLGAQAVSEELDKLGIEHTLELFDGKHGGIAHRYPGAIRELVLALAP